MACVSLRLGKGIVAGGWRGGEGGGEPEGEKFQPVGYFEVEVTSSGLKKNCQAGPPGPGWPLGSLHWPPGPFPPGPQPRSRGPQPQQWALNSKVALLVQYQARTLTQAQVPVLRPRYSKRSVLGLPGGAQEVYLLLSVSGLQCKVPR